MHYVIIDIDQSSNFTINSFSSHNKISATQNFAQYIDPKFQNSYSINGIETNKQDRYTELQFPVGHSKWHTVYHFYTFSIFYCAMPGAQPQCNEGMEVWRNLELQSIIFFSYQL